MSEPVFDRDRADQLKALWERHLRGLGAIGVVTWCATGLAALGFAGALWQYLRLNTIEGRVQAANTQLDDKMRDLSRSASAALVPVGTICAWAGSLPVRTTGDGKPNPWWDYWAVCDGSTVKRKTHPELWAVLGTVYGPLKAGVTQDEDEVALPDFVGAFLRGIGGAALALGQRQDHALAAHTHKGVLAPRPLCLKPDFVNSGNFHENPLDQHTIAQLGDTRDHESEATGQEETRPLNY